MVPAIGKTSLKYPSYRVLLKLDLVGFYMTSKWRSRGRVVPRGVSGPILYVVSRISSPLLWFPGAFSIYNT